MRAPVLYVMQRGLAANCAQLAAMAEVTYSTSSSSGWDHSRSSCIDMSHHTVCGPATSYEFAVLLLFVLPDRCWRGGKHQIVTGEAACARRLSAGMAAAQVLLFVRAIAAAAPHSQAATFGPARWQRLWQGRLVEDARGSGAAAAAGSQWRDGGASDGEEEGGDAIELV
jgi:hypothetical protein